MGADKETRSDFQLIAGTNCDLRKYLARFDLDWAGIGAVRGR